jgi:hypothetical protein
LRVQHIAALPAKLGLQARHLQQVDDGRCLGRQLAGLGQQATIGRQEAHTVDAAANEALRQAGHQGQLSNLVRVVLQGGQRLHDIRPAGDRAQRRQAGVQGVLQRQRTGVGRGAGVGDDRVDEVGPHHGERRSARRQGHDRQGGQGTQGHVPLKPGRVTHVGGHERALQPPQARRHQAHADRGRQQHDVV